MKRFLVNLLQALGVFVVVVAGIAVLCVIIMGPIYEWWPFWVSAAFWHTMLFVWCYVGVKAWNDGKDRKP